MNETKFTKGPWRNDGADELNGVPFIAIMAGEEGTPSCRTICEVSSTEDERRSKFLLSAEDHANANLIAAAPEMHDLALLFRKTVAYYIAADQKAGDSEGAKLKQFTLAQIDAVISKAEGRTP